MYYPQISAVICGYYGTIIYIYIRINIVPWFKCGYYRTMVLYTHGLRTFFRQVGLSMGAQWGFLKGDQDFLGRRVLKFEWRSPTPCWNCHCHPLPMSVKNRITGFHRIQWIIIIFTLELFFFFFGGQSSIFRHKWPGPTDGFRVGDYQRVLDSVA